MRPVLGLELVSPVPCNEVVGKSRFQAGELSTQQLPHVPGESDMGVKTKTLIWAHHDPFAIHVIFLDL